MERFGRGEAKIWIGNINKKLNVLNTKTGNGNEIRREGQWKKCDEFFLFFIILKRKFFVQSVIFVQFPSHISWDSSALLQTLYIPQPTQKIHHNCYLLFFNLFFRHNSSPPKLIASNFCWQKRQETLAARTPPSKRSHNGYASANLVEPRMCIDLPHKMRVDVLLLPLCIILIVMLSIKKQ